MAMLDINGEEFLVGDRLKVIKTVEEPSKFSVGDVVECILDDGTNTCKFNNLKNGKQGYFYNHFFQKL